MLPPWRPQLVFCPSTLLHREKLLPGFDLPHGEHTFPGAAPPPQPADACTPLEVDPNVAQQ